MQPIVYRVRHNGNTAHTALKEHDMSTTATTLQTIAAAHAETATTARQQLTEKITAHYTGVELVPHLHRVITTEATHKVYADTVTMLTRGATTDTVRHYLTDLVLQSPNDAWSGRGNDAERVRADAVRTAVRDLLATLTD